MAKSDSYDEQLAAPEHVLQGLARELAEPLLYIARQAEFSAEKDRKNADALRSIEQSANGALRLIDSYLLTAQSEYGQKQLPLQTVGAGSVLYDAVHDLRSSAERYGYILEVDSRYSKPIMTNVLALKTAIVCLGNLLMCSSAARDVRVRRLRIATYKRDDSSCTIGILDSGSTNLAKRDMLQARKLQGRSHMALPKLDTGSGVQLALADSLAMALNAELKVIRRYKTNGFGLTVARSDQLQLVA